MSKKSFITSTTETFLPLDDRNCVKEVFELIGGSDDGRSGKGARGAVGVDASKRFSAWQW